MQIKPQRGVRYECYMGYTDNMGTRVRRGRLYIFEKDNFHGFYLMYTASGKGYSIAVDKDKFTSHFIPVNPII